MEIPAISEDEPRFLLIGKLNGKCYSCIFTYRGRVIRLISTRRSRKMKRKSTMPSSKNPRSIKAKELDKLFEEGDVTEYLDLKSAKSHYPMHRVSIDFTQDMLEKVDHEAARIGVTRTSLIKVWVAERLSQQQETTGY